VLVILLSNNWDLGFVVGGQHVSQGQKETIAGGGGPIG